MPCSRRAMLLVSLPHCSACWLQVYFMGGLRLSAGAFFANWASVLLLVLVAQSFGLVIGALVPIPKTAQTITTVAALTMVLVSALLAAADVCSACHTCMRHELWS